MGIYGLTYSLYHPGGEQTSKRVEYSYTVYLLVLLLKRTLRESKLIEW